MPTQNTGMLVIRLPQERADELRSLARRLAAERDEDVTLSALVREALEARYWPSQPITTASAHPETF